jgi:hypothetical protein
MGLLDDSHATSPRYSTTTIPPNNFMHTGSGRVEVESMTVGDDALNPTASLLSSARNCGKPAASGFADNPVCAKRSRYFRVGQLRQFDDL